jgi:hypothetical protein
MGGKKVRFLCCNEWRGLADLAEMNESGGRRRRVERSVGSFGERERKVGKKEGTGVYINNEKHTSAPEKEKRRTTAGHRAHAGNRSA